jgi:hypothetical protein
MTIFNNFPAKRGSFYFLTMAGWYNTISKGRIKIKVTVRRGGIK